MGIDNIISIAMINLYLYNYIRLFLNDYFRYFAENNAPACFFFVVKVIYMRTCYVRWSESSPPSRVGWCGVTLRRILIVHNRAVIYKDTEKSRKPTKTKYRKIKKAKKINMFVDRITKFSWTIRCATLTR